MAFLTNHMILVTGTVVTDYCTNDFDQNSKFPVSAGIKDME